MRLMWRGNAGSIVSAWDKEIMAKYRRAKRCGEERKASHEGRKGREGKTIEAH
jgi:hypothetical protein